MAIFNSYVKLPEGMLRDVKKNEFSRGGFNPKWIACPSRNRTGGTGET